MCLFARFPSLSRLRPVACQKRSAVAWGGWLLLSLVLGSLAACSSPPQAFKIGVLHYLDAEGGISGPVVNSVRLAVAQANAGPGLQVNGHPVTVTLAFAGFPIDGGPEAAVDAAQKLLAQERVAALVGPQLSVDAIPVAALADQVGVPMIAYYAANVQVTAGKRCVFRGVIDDSGLGQAFAQFAALDIGARRVGVLYDETSPYAQRLAQIFARAFEQSGGQVMLETFLPTDTDFTPQLARMKAGGIRLLFLPTMPTCIQKQLQQVHDLGLAVTLLGGGAWDPAVMQSVPYVEGAFQAVAWHSGSPRPESRAFLQAYRAAYAGEPDARAALAYDAVRLLLQALRDQGRLDAVSICAGLRNIRYSGVSGAFRFDAAGTPLEAAGVFIQFKNGRSVFYRDFNP